MVLDTGKILISDPFLKDPNFMRTVIFLCEYNKKGGFGFVLNRLYKKKLQQLVETIVPIDFPVYYGGPVQVDTLHFLHTRPDIINEGLLIDNNIFWGGNFEQAIINIANKNLSTNDIRFYVGYSGWEKGQLEAEIDEKSWIVYNSSKQNVFYHNPSGLWKNVLNQMGGEYKMMTNFPIDPQLN